jgi:transcriptional regulator with XRE-family HTH domain
VAARRFLVMSVSANPDTTRLRERRKALGLTQQELAWRARCSVSMLQLFERGLTAVQRGDVAARIDATLRKLEDEIALAGHLW